MNKFAAPLIYLLVTGMAAISIQAQDRLARGKAADVGMSATGLRAAARLYKTAVDKDELRGVVLLVARHRRIVLHEAYGWRDLKKEKPMEKASLFRMASNSKAVTALGALMLVDEHRLALDEPVCKHLPGFDNPRGNKITVKQLLTHTSGLRIKPIFLKPLIQKSSEHPDAPSLQVEVARFGAIGAEKEPGATWMYNNAGYNTLAALIESKREALKAAKP